MNATGNRGLLNRIRFHLLFFRSTLGVSIPMAAAFAVLIVFSSTTKGIVESIFAFFGCIPLGYFLGLLYKEMSLKGEYYFYYNRGIGRWELWIVSLLLSCSFVVCSCLIAGLWKLV